MPPLLSPKQLLWSCVSAAGSMVLSQVLASPDPIQEAKIRVLVHRLLPPVMLQELLCCVLRQLAVHQPPRASPSVISCLLRILAHPQITNFQLSDLSYVGSVELETLDKVESALVHILPSLNRLTHLDLSTHRQKVTLPSCSTGVLQAIGCSCPNLVLLNLNYNNRVMSDGLVHLYPGTQKTGCPKLEQIFLQDCSIEPEDVAMLLHVLPELRLVGYRELGTSLQMLKSRPRRFGISLNGNSGSSKRRRRQYTLRLTHVDNTMSHVQRCDGEIVDFLLESCPDVENLKIRVCDEDVGDLGRLSRLQHLELRFYTGVHHPIGPATTHYLTGPGAASLSSLTIFCHTLHSRHVAIIAKSCHNLTKLYLHANLAMADSPLPSHLNKLRKLEVLSLRVGHDELVMSPSACDLVVFLVCGAPDLQELYLLVRSPALNHSFMTDLLTLNPLPCLKILIADAPRRTLLAPMLEFNIETAYLFINACPNLQILGNLICWNVTPDEVAVLQAMKRICNYNLTIIYKHLNKIKDKLAA